MTEWSTIAGPGSVRIRRGTARNTPPESIARPQEIRDGAVLIEEVTSDPIVEVRGDFEVELAVARTTPIGSVHLLEGLDMLNRATVNTLNFLHGAARCGAPALAD